MFLFCYKIKLRHIWQTFWLHYASVRNRLSFEKFSKKGLILGLVKGLHLYQNISNTCSNYEYPFQTQLIDVFFYYNFFCMLTLSLTYTCCNNALLSSILMPLWCQRTVPYSWIDMSFIKVNDLSHIFIVVGLPKNGRFPPEYFSWKPFFNCFIVDRSIH